VQEPSRRHLESGFGVMLGTLPSGFPLFLVVFLIVVLLIGIAIWMVIFRKAGFSKWWGWGLLIHVPLFSLVAFYFLLFREWPIQREVKEIRRKLAQNGSLSPMP
jgi:hypothetical protein